MKSLLTKITRNYLDDLLILGGCGLIMEGTYQICPVATWFVGGIILVVWGVLVGLGKRGVNDHP